MPALTLAHARGHLTAAHRAAGFEVDARVAEPDEIAQLSTTWAKKLALAGGGRCFFVLEVTRGRAQVKNSYESEGFRNRLRARFAATGPSVGRYGLQAILPLRR